MGSIVTKSFYRQHPLITAPALLGTLLVREYKGIELQGMITETEAYLGLEDSACHAYKGKTPRNAILFGEPGNAYVYFIYGMYNMLNVVAGKSGVPWAILIRAVVPVHGIETMCTLRGKTKNISDGPGKLCKAFAIDRILNGWDMTKGDTLWIEKFKTIPDTTIEKAPRVGIDYARPEHKLAHWRYTLRGVEKYL